MDRPGLKSARVFNTEDTEGKAPRARRRGEHELHGGEGEPEGGSG